MSDILSALYQTHPVLPRNPSVNLYIDYTSKMAAMWAADIRHDSYEFYYKQLAGKSSI